MPTNNCCPAIADRFGCLLRACCIPGNHGHRCAGPPPPPPPRGTRRHPPFIKIMDEVQQGLRYLFQTDSKYTLCASGCVGSQGDAGGPC